MNRTTPSRSSLFPRVGGPVPGTLQEYTVPVALRTCAQAYFPDLYTQRHRVALSEQRRATAGENDGRHAQGYQILHQTLLEQDYETIVGRRGADLCHHQHNLIYKRPTVMDAEDRRMQLALALYQPPPPNDDCIRIQRDNDGSHSLFMTLCLLSDFEHEYWLVRDATRLNDTATCGKSIHLPIPDKTNVGRG